MKILHVLLALPCAALFAVTALAQAPQSGTPANPLRGAPVTTAPAATPSPTEVKPAQEPRERRARRSRSQNGEASTSRPKREPSAAQVALRARQKQCGVNWRADKAAGKVQAGQKWPQYWSACNKRLKGANT